MTAWPSESVTPLFYIFSLLSGGVFATFAPHLVIKHNSVDMVCVGEGETCIVNLCEKLSAGIDYSDVPNLWIKDQFGKIRKNPPAPLTNLDTLPIMDFGIFEENRIFFIP